MSLQEDYLNQIESFRDQLKIIKPQIAQFKATALSSDLQIKMISYKIVNHASKLYSFYLSELKDTNLAYRTLISTIGFIGQYAFGVSAFQYGTTDLAKELEMRKINYFFEPFLGKSSNHFSLPFYYHSYALDYVISLIKQAFNGIPNILNNPSLYQTGTFSESAKEYIINETNLLRDEIIEGFSLAYKILSFEKNYGSLQSSLESLKSQINKFLDTMSPYKDQLGSLVTLDDILNSVTDDGKDVIPLVEEEPKIIAAEPAVSLAVSNEPVKKSKTPLFIALGLGALFLLTKGK